MAMEPKGEKALMLVLDKDKKGEASSGYDEDMKMAVEDLADALGVKLKDASKAIEAMKTIHALCSEGE